MFNKRRSLCVCIILLCMLMSLSCSSAPHASVPSNESTDAASEPLVSKAGFALGQAVSAEKLDELRSGDKQFVVYFTGKKSSENETVLQDKLNTLVENYSDAFLVDYYTIPIGDYPQAKDILGGNLFGLVLFRSEGAVVLSGDSLSDVGSSFNRFFEYELVSPDDHGLPIVTYEQVMEKINGGETFILYVGRDTCPQCRLFSPNLEKGIVDAGLSTPVYYFYVEDYHRAQERGEEGAQDKWNADASSIGFQGTPALLYFNEGAGATFDFFNSLFPEDAKTPEDFDESNRLCLEALKNWIAENNIK